MERYRIEPGPDGVPRLKVPYRGPQLLSHPMYNKSTAFTRSERRVFGLEGLLPDAVSTLSMQARRAYANNERKSDPLERYIGLAALQDRNETLFYRLLVDHLEEFLPIVYTPTVGRAGQEFSHIFRRARGLWITPDDRGRIDRVLADAPFEDVRLIVVTDNESILGLGDQGAGGMAIPVGKLALYTAAAGIHPAHTLPISLDVGTDNQALLERYRKALPSFNDDIQGTAAVAVAGVMAASRVTGVPLARQRVVILGAGAAGAGIGRLVRDALRRAGVAGEDLLRAVALVDTHGLVTEEGAAGDYRRELAWPAALAASAGLGTGAPHGLAAVVRALRPTVLIGVSGAAGAFTEEVVRVMAAGAERPVIFPLSNPTSQSEAAPADIAAWTEGRALVATGSPFAPVTHAGRTTRVGQGNNAFIFPGVGLGALVSEAREITEGLFTAAAEQLASEVRDEDLAAGGLFPPIADLRRVTARIAEAVVRRARDEGTGRPLADEEIPRAVAAAMWDPVYVELEPA